MKEVKGVLSETPVGGYGSGDPFGDGLAEAIPANTTSPKEESEQESIVDQDENEGDGHILYNILKRDGLVDDDIEIGKDADLKTAITKIADTFKTKAEKMAEDIARQKGWTDENFKYAKMLDMGLSPAEQTEIAKLNAYSKVEINLDDETATQNCVHIVQEMYRDRLSGKALQKALDNVDPMSDDFQEEAKEAVEYWSGKKNAYIDVKLKEQEAIERDALDFDQKIRQNIETGEIYGIKLDKKDIKAYADKIYAPTETITVKENGKDVVRKVSKYEKEYHDLLKDPAKMGRLMMFIADGLDNKLAFEAGKAKYADELEAKLSGRIYEKSQPTKATSLGTVRGFENILDTRTY